MYISENKMWFSTAKIVQQQNMKQKKSMEITHTINTFTQEYLKSI